MMVMVIPVQVTELCFGKTTGNSIPSAAEVQLSLEHNKLAEMTMSSTMWNCLGTSRIHTVTCVRVYYNYNMCVCDVLPPLAPHHDQLHSIPHPPSFLVFCELVEDKQSTNTIFERKSLLDLERMVWKYAMTCGNFGQVARLLVRNLGL